MDELTAAVSQFSVEVVEASRRVARETLGACMVQVVQPLVQALARADSRFKAYVPLPTDHYWEACKVSASDEFELLVVLDSLVGMKSLRDLGETVTASTPPQSLAGYGEVMFAHGFSSNDLWAADLCVAPTRPGPHSYLSATRVRQYFCKLVAMVAADIFNNGQVSVTYKEPYTVVKVSRQGDQAVFRLVPCLYFPEAWPPCTAPFAAPDRMTSWMTPEVATHCRQLGYFALPLPCPYTTEESVWRLSFVRAEKYLLRHDGLNSPQGVRKQVERILKMLRTADTDAFTPLSSFHLRTVVLHTCQQSCNDSLWSPQRLGERLVETLRHLIVCLEEGSLPHFFVPTCNTLAQFSQQQRLSCAASLRSVHDELCSNPANSIRLQC